MRAVAWTRRWIPSRANRSRGARGCFGFLVAPAVNFLRVADPKNGVAYRFVQNRTPGGQGRERSPNISWEPKRSSGIGHAPDMVAGQTDVTSPTMRVNHRPRVRPPMSPRGPARQW